ncbi:MAG: GTP-binding protein [Armatimonadetes bacterium]|nr:GTP-binding protein [Armatimonadota bacterium]
MSTTCSPLTHSGQYLDAIPVTVVTGFLGSGKTTLLNHLLRSRPDRRIAVIENDFGETSIDHDLVIATRRNLFALSDGCVCCTVRPELMRILTLLTKRAQPYDHIVIETTGLADPAPVAQTFFVDDRVKRKARLDAVVTVVDARHVMQHIEASRVCLDQVAFADLILVNKCDLATPEELDHVESRIRQVNAAARIQRITFGQAPVDEVLEHGGFNLEQALRSKPAFLQEDYPFEHVSVYGLRHGAHTLTLQAEHEEPLGVLMVPNDATMPELERAATTRVLAAQVETVSCEASVEIGIPVRLDMRNPGSVKRFHLHVPESGEYALFAQYNPREFGLRFTDGSGHAQTPLTSIDYTLAHAHDDSVASVTLRHEGALDEARLARWLTRLLHGKSASLYRLKGIVALAGKPNRCVIHGVHSLLNFTEDRPWEQHEERSSQLVFIGRGLDRRALRRAFRNCIARQD